MKTKIFCYFSIFLVLLSTIRSNQISEIKDAAAYKSVNNMVIEVYKALDGISNFNLISAHICEKTNTEKIKCKEFSKLENKHILNNTKFELTNKKDALFSQISSFSLSKEIEYSKFLYTKFDFSYLNSENFYCPVFIICLLMAFIMLTFIIIWGIYLYKMKRHCSPMHKLCMFLFIGRFLLTCLVLTTLIYLRLGKYFLYNDSNYIK